MASRRKKHTGTTSPAKPTKTTATKKRAVAATAAKSRKRSPKEAVDELQTVGADVVPSVTIEADAEAATVGGLQSVASTPDTKLSEAGPILDGRPGGGRASGEASDEKRDRSGPAAEDRGAAAAAERPRAKRAAAGAASDTVREAGPVIDERGAAAGAAAEPRRAKRPAAGAASDTVREAGPVFDEHGAAAGAAAEPRRAKRPAGGAASDTAREAGPGIDERGAAAGAAAEPRRAKPPAAGAASHNKVREGGSVVDDARTAASAASDTAMREGRAAGDDRGAGAGAAAEATRAARPAGGAASDTMRGAGPVVEQRGTAAADPAAPGTKLSEAGPILDDASAAAAPAVAVAVEEASAATGRDAGTARREPVVEPAAIREHTIDQIAPVGADGRPESLLSDWDFHLFNEGTHHRLWDKLGSHIVPGGVMFGVWAPNAGRVSVVGDFNGWDPNANPLHSRGPSGVWEGFVPGLGRGATYKYHIVSRHNGYTVNKADPMAVHHETPPATASKVWDLEYEWHDEKWMRARRERNKFEAPMSIYEVHLGSWRRISDDGGHTWRPMSYREIAVPLAEYVRRMNFTHIELMPVQEHPFYGSWGYQGTGYFAPTSRFGTPQDFKYLVDVLHQHDIGVIIDWVPSHFPSDEHGLAYFDGTHLYEHADPRKGFHPDWGSLVFNYGRNEVRAFLLSSALYWLDEYHADGLRVDAVASMLYLDYSRKAGEWIPNEFGGRENIEAISFLRRVNEDVYKVHPDVQVIAEESTAWPMVSRPTYVGGLGFGMKWDMGWMHDTLRYFSKDPVHRKYHHNDLTFRMMYAFTENFVLPLSHDEVVHGKGSLIGKMPGDEWRRAANLRLLFAHMYANPGKKLLFMGGEIGQYREWNHDAGLDWHLLDDPLHAGINRWVEDLNKAYRDVAALHELDIHPDGFEWIDCCDTENSVVTLARKSRTRPDEVVVIALNFTPMPRHSYQIGLPRGGWWRELLNSDAPLYGGSGQGNMGGVDAVPIPLHGRRWSAAITLPPLGAVFLISQSEGADVASGVTEYEEPVLV